MRKIKNHPVVDILIFTSVLFLKLWLVCYLLFESDVFYLTGSGRILTFTGLLFLGLTAYFFCNRVRKLLLLGYNAVLSLLVFVCVLYYQHFSDFPSMSMIYLLSQLRDVANSIDYQGIFSYIWLFADVVLGFILLRYFSKRTQAETNRSWSAIHLSVYILVMISLLFFNVIYGLERVGEYEKRNASRIVVSMVGFPNYFAYDIAYFVLNQWNKPEIKDGDIERFAHYFVAQKPDVLKNETYGIFRGKNLLFVQFESLSSFVVGMKIGGMEVTPNLNWLVKNSFYSENFYAEIGGGHSADAELVSLTSLYPLDRSSVNILYGNNEYFSLPKIMKQEGYYTVSAHAYRGEFWNRRVMHQSLGFETSWFQEDFKETERIGFGLPDAPFFDQVIMKLSTVPQPFMGYFITLESHTPFFVPEEKKELNLGDLEGTEIGNYLHSLHNADKGLGILIQKLKEKGLYDNTVIVLYGDHDVELPKEKLEPVVPLNNAFEIIFYKKVPFLIHSAKGELNATYSGIMGHADILPTILHLWGIDPNKWTFYGKNIFSSSKRGYVRIFQGHVVTDDYAIINIGSSFDEARVFNAKTKKEMPKTQEMKDLYEKVQVEYQQSSSIIQLNLIPLILEVQRNEVKNVVRTPSS